MTWQVMKQIDTRCMIYENSFQITSIWRDHNFLILTISANPSGQPSLQWWPASFTTCIQILADLSPPAKNRWQSSLIPKMQEGQFSAVWPQNAFVCSHFSAPQKPLFAASNAAFTTCKPQCFATSHTDGQPGIQGLYSHEPLVIMQFVNLAAN